MPHTWAASRKEVANRAHLILKLKTSELKILTRGPHRRFSTCFLR